MRWFDPELNVGKDWQRSRSNQEILLVSEDKHLFLCFVWFTCNFVRFFIRLSTTCSSYMLHIWSAYTSLRLKICCMPDNNNRGLRAFWMLSDEIIIKSPTILLRHLSCSKSDQGITCKHKCYCQLLTPNSINSSTEQWTPKNVKFVRFHKLIHVHYKVP